MLRSRTFWLATLAAAYVAFAALRATDGGAAGWVALAALPFGLAAAWRLTSSPELRSEARAAARVVAAGAAVLLAARAGSASPAFVAMANAGAAAATIGGLLAVARVRARGGVIAAVAPSANGDPASPSIAAFAALLWTVAVALPAAKAAWPARFGELDPTTLDYATSVAALGSLLLDVATSLRMHAARRLELGVVDRARGAFLVALMVLAVALAIALAGVAPPESILPEASVVAAVALASSAIAPDPTFLRSAVANAIAIAILGAPPALAAAYLARAFPARAGGAALAGALGAALGVLAAPIAVRRFGRREALWMRALELATRAAMNPDPDAALESALHALRGLAARGDVTAALYRLDPKERVTVDRAGYASSQRAEIEPRVLELADEEPERVLLVEVARAVVVRRPDVREAVAWLDQRGYGAAAIVRDAADVIGVLCLPVADLTLAEVRLLRDLCDRIGAVAGSSAMLARSRAREIEARTEIEALRARATELASASARAESRLSALANMLERPARAAAYGPASRATVEALERMVDGKRPITLITAPGVDATAWAALAHLASKRKDGPLTIVDATSAAEHSLDHWRDPARSPIRAAAGGSLVVLDAHALPDAVQSYLAAAIPDDVGVLVTLPSTVDSLVARGALNERLADRLGDRAIGLPTLASRAEDLRALAIDQLGRIGVRLGRPLGLEDRALAALLEHAWPGNDAELHAVLLRAALVAKGDAIGVDELTATGFTVATVDVGRQAEEAVSRAGPLTRAAAKPRRGSKAR